MRNIPLKQHSLTKSGKLKKLPAKLSQILKLPYFNSLLRATPVNPEWGFARGMPIDRFYITNFLSENAELVRGDVLSIGDDYYAQKYGQSTLKNSDVLHISESQEATIVADLTNAPQIPF